MKPRTARLLKILVSAAFLAAIYAWINPADLAARFRSVALLPLGCAVVLNLVLKVFNAAKIRLLFPEPRPRLAGMAAVNFITEFFGSFIPGNVGRELARWAYMSKESGAKSRALAAILLDRVTGLWAQILLALAAWIWIGRGGMSLWISLPVSVAIFSASVWACAWGYRWMTGVARKLGAWYSRRGGKGGVIPEGIDEALGELLSERSRFARVAAFSLANHSLVIVTFLLIDRSVGGDLDYPHAVLYLFLYSFIVLLPITLGNWGLSEGALGVLYHSAGAQSETGVLIALLLRAMNLPAVALGWYFFLVRRYRAEGDENPLPGNIRQSSLET